jgi:hypothetical protein
MRFPAPFKVGVHSYAAGASDAYNIINPGYTPPLTGPGTPTAVYGWSVPRTAEPALTGHDRVIIDVQLFAPAGTAITAYDWIDLPDGIYEVIGAADDYTHDPFSGGGAGTAGLVFNLRKVSG